MLDTLQKIYSELTGDYDTVITLKTRLDKDLMLSSLGKVQLVCRIEEELDLEIPAEKLHSLKTVKDIVKYLEKEMEE